MGIKKRQAQKVKPTHPGAILREDFLDDYGLTVASLAGAIGTSRQTINELLRERRALTPVMALRLSKLFGNRPDFWLDAQRAVDLWEAEKQYRKKLNGIKRIRLV
ncbi:MAG: addiction module antidote protein, HigA family [Syntrophus sp. (in: bacteria)]|nr:addiction module antidote protein, HigA family [Syntrophus sp. (in: bacteria)]